MRKSLALSLLAAALLTVGCGPADAGRVPEAAQRIFDQLREREYERIYEDASSAVRKAYGRDAFLNRLRDLESFGQLVEIEADGAPTIVEEGHARVATARYTARFAFAEGPFELKLRANDMLGTWELEGYDYDVAATTYDPPYPADEAGAEQLVRRFFHLWQNRRYGDLRRVMRIEEDPQKVRHFLENLEKGEKILTVARDRFSTQTSGRRTTANARYVMQFKNGKGWIVFKLIDAGGEWRIDSADYQIEYKM
jgi:hypothetical protein